MNNNQNGLYHYGILGQKWGVRRYQNKDGSLTPAGEARYYNKDGSLTKAGQFSRRDLSWETQQEHLKKLHDSKSKKPDDPDVDYFSRTATKGKEYIKNVSKQILEGKVTSFVEKSNGERTNGKTAKGVVARDADGNRITLGDYSKAMNLAIKRTGGYRLRTGSWD